MPDKQTPPSEEIDEDDPELERDLHTLAQWLFDVYLWRLEEEGQKETKED